MGLHILQVPGVGRGALSREDEVVFTPNDQSRRLILPEEGLELGIERNIGPVAEEQIQLDLGVPGPIQTDLIQCPGCRIQQGAVGHAVFILPSCRLWIDQEADALSILSCWILQYFLIGFQNSRRPSSYALPFWTISACTRSGCRNA